MLLADAIAAGVTGAVIGGGLAAIIVFVVQDRTTRRQQLAARAKSEAEFRKLRREAAAAGERARLSDERQAQQGKIRELEWKRQRDALEEREAALQFEVGQLRDDLARQSDVSRRAEEADRLRERLTEERRGFQADRERFETTERELKVMIRALEKMGTELKGVAERREQAFREQATRLEQLEFERRAAMEQIVALEQKATSGEAELASLRQEMEKRAALDAAGAETATGDTVLPPAEAAPLEVPGTEERASPIAASARSLRELAGLGRAAEKRFAELGIRTVEELLSARPDALAPALGRRERSKLDGWLRAARDLPPAPVPNKRRRRLKTGGAAPEVRDGGD